MAKENKKRKKQNKDNQYNADNEIIIGVTTKPKEKKVNTPKKQKSIHHGQAFETTNIQEKTVTKKKTNSSKMKKNKQTKSKQNHNWTQETKEQEIKRKNRKRLLISIGMLIIVAIGGTIYFLTTPMFNIMNIEVIGNQKNTKEMYISLSQIEIGTTNIFSVTGNGIQAKLKENPYVETVIMKRKLPNTLELSVTERKLTYQAEWGDKYLYFNEQGYLLEISEEKADVMIIKGLSSIEENIQEGKRLKEQDLKKLSVILEITNYCKYHAIENTITSIDVTDTNNYTVYFEKDNKILYLGDASNINERLSLLKAILTSEKGKKGEIFMNGNITEDKVFFREEV